MGTKRTKSFLAVAAACLAASAFFLVFTGVGLKEGSVDAVAIRKSLDVWTSRMDFELPRSSAARGRISSGAARTMNVNYQATLVEVGTSELRQMPGIGSGFDHARYLAGFRSIGHCAISAESRVLSVDVEEILDNGDVVVWAKVWGGETTAAYPSGKVGLGPYVIVRLDDTPTYAYQMRRVDDRWRIVSETLVRSSEDDSPEYGPDTPHFEGPVLDGGPTVDDSGRVQLD